jgi:hypothetical protein
MRELVEVWSADADGGVSSAGRYHDHHTSRRRQMEGVLAALRGSTTTCRSAPQHTRGSPEMTFANAQPEPDFEYHSSAIARLVSELQEEIDFPRCAIGRV